jgi:hypothetical protein
MKIILLSIFGKIYINYLILNIEKPKLNDFIKLETNSNFYNNETNNFYFFYL